MTQATCNMIVFPSYFQQVLGYCILRVTGNRAEALDNMMRVIHVMDADKLPLNASQAELTHAILLAPKR